MDRASAFVVETTVGKPTMTSRVARTSTSLALVLVAGVAVVGLRCNTDDDAPEWSASLPGEVVFAAREAGVSSIYRVAANGAGRTQLFKNDDPVDPNALYPSWVDEGRRIRFTAMRDGVWAGYEMDADGRAVHADGDPDFRLLSVPGAAPDLEVSDDAIWATGPDGERRLIHRAPASRGHVAYANVAWGPDKRFVIFQACDLFERCEVQVARADGAGVFVIGPGRHPSWTW
ncbi:MAG: hypothetical protein CVU56_22620 [Deltaproteobacteria bacterium HGW-Deltaproteobacteria-14]|jgi:hypothetical protein|nr:MAG: hypothetical protein CVU56_22620 [Deltaproteobacteria bacterium HGW-Deltaproteobacteria-14]